MSEAKPTPEPQDEAVIQEHARLSGFPASKITEVRRMIDPTTAGD